MEMEDRMIQLRTLDCTACGACQNICQNQAVSMVRNKKGFLYPQIDADRCTECGQCLRVCPLEKELMIEQLTEAKVFALKSRNSDLRWRSTSGGAFSELAKIVLKRGGSIVGAAYQQDWSVKHEMINTEEEMDRLRRSKYQQSEMGFLYQKIKEELLKGREVLFCGTPCQAGGLRGYLDKEYSNLYICDFICRAVSSPLLFQKYIQELQEKYGSEIESVWMKNKCKGWHNLSTVINFKNGEQYVSKGRADTYVRLLLLYNMGVRTSCYTCRFKGRNAVSDITLGDFWGLEHLDFDDNLGTSVVMCRTEKGLQLVKQILPNNDILEMENKDVVKGNPCLVHPLEKSDSREEEFFETLNQFGYKEAYELASNTSNGENIPLESFDDEKYKSITHEKPVYMWGTGACAGQLLTDIPRIQIEGFIDNNRKNKRACIAGNLLPVISPSEIPENAFVIVASTDYYGEIKEQLLSMGRTEVTDFVSWEYVYM